MLKINKEDNEIRIKIPSLSSLKNIPFILICLLCIPFIYYFIYFSGIAGLFVCKSILESIPFIYNAHIFFKLCFSIVIISLLIDACFIYDLFPEYGILNELNNLNIEYKEDMKAVWPCVLLFVLFSLFYLVGSFNLLDTIRSSITSIVLFVFNCIYSVGYLFSLFYIVCGQFEIIKIKKDI